MVGFETHHHFVGTLPPTDAGMLDDCPVYDGNFRGEWPAGAKGAAQAGDDDEREDTPGYPFDRPETLLEPAMLVEVQPLFPNGGLIGGTP